MASNENTERTSESDSEDSSVDPRQGLSSEQAEQRLAQQGANEIREEQESRVKMLLKHFWGPIPWMLEAAIALSVASQRWEDFAVILFMLVLNGGIGFWHETKPRAPLPGSRRSSRRRRVSYATASRRP